MESVEATGGTTFRNRGSVFVEKETGLSFCTPPGEGRGGRFWGERILPKKKTRVYITLHPSQSRRFNQQDLGNIALS